jgi:hypothetical protein
MGKGWLKLLPCNLNFTESTVHLPKIDVFMKIYRSTRMIDPRGNLLFLSFLSPYNSLSRSNNW